MTNTPRVPLSNDQVRHVADLARLRLDDEHVERYCAQLSSVLDHIAKLNELDLTGVEPLAHPTELSNRLEDDEIGRSMAVAQLLVNAPAVEDRFLAVPKVLAQGES